MNKKNLDMDTCLIVIDFTKLVTQSGRCSDFVVVIYSCDVIEKKRTESVPTDVHTDQHALLKLSFL